MKSSGKLFRPKGVEIVAYATGGHKVVWLWYVYLLDPEGNRVARVGCGEILLGPKGEKAALKAAEECAELYADYDRSAFVRTVNLVAQRDPETPFLVPDEWTLEKGYWYKFSEEA